MDNLTDLSERARKAGLKCDILMDRLQDNPEEAQQISKELENVELEMLAVLEEIWEAELAAA